MNNIIAFIMFTAVLSISTNTSAGWSDRSGSVFGAGDYQPPQHLRIVQFHDFLNYYAYVELEGIKAEEVDIQRHGPQITFRQVRGRMEENESKNTYSSFQSYSSITRRITLPLDADPDTSKMKRDNNENFIRLTIPKRVF